jgi:hypothetical protein
LEKEKLEMRNVGCKVVAVAVAVLLLTSQLAFGQTAPAPKKVGHYTKLFALANGIAAQTKNNCKTEACASR